MAKMSDVQAQRARKPLHVVQLPASAFVDKPDLPTVAIGLRFVSEEDMATAQAEAARKTVEAFADAATDPRMAEQFDDAFNSAQMAWIVARGTCDPTSIDLDWIAAPEVAIPRTLRPEGIATLFDEWRAWVAKHDPTMPVATTDDVEALTVALADGALYDLPRTTAKFALRLASILLDTIRGGASSDEAAAMLSRVVAEGDDDQGDDLAP